MDEKEKSKGIPLRRFSRFRLPWLLTALLFLLVVLRFEFGGYRLERVIYPLATGALDSLYTSLCFGIPVLVVVPLLVYASRLNRASAAGEIGRAALITEALSMIFFAIATLTLPIFLVGPPSLINMESAELNGTLYHLAAKFPGRYFPDTFILYRCDSMGLVCHQQEIYENDTMRAALEIQNNQIVVIFERRALSGG